LLKNVDFYFPPGTLQCSTAGGGWDCVLAHSVEIPTGTATAVLVSSCSVYNYDLTEIRLRRDFEATGINPLVPTVPQKGTV